MKTLLRLSKLILPLFPVMALAIIFGTLGFFCAIGIPVAGVMALTAKTSLSLLVLAGIARGVLHYAEQYCNHFIAFTLLARIRNIVFAKLRALGPARLESKQKGNLIALITSDIELLELFYAHTVSPVCIALLVSAATVAFVAHYNGMLALVALISYGAVGICIPLAVRHRSSAAGTIQRERVAQMHAFLLDSLRGLLQSILYGNGDKTLRDVREKSEGLSRSTKTIALHDGYTSALIEGMVFLCDSAMLIVAVMLYQRGTIPFATAVITTATLFSSFGPVVAVARLGSSLSQTVAAGKRVLALLDENPVVAQVENQSAVSNFTGAELDSVHFSYEISPLHQHTSSRNDRLEKSERNENAEILSDISLKFEKGGIIGLQGKSGSGKSTILKLLMHFWHADSGSVRISNLPIEKINTASLRNLESYVTQETVLFHDTIENNIRIAKLDATHEEIVEACRRAAVHDFIASLPNGYDTQVSELGDNFSGGERQRLGLARAFLHDGAFLLLDEPTSNLDSFNESIILESVKQESAKKTIVLVSHRESTLSCAKTVYKIESGRRS